MTKKTSPTGADPAVTPAARVEQAAADLAAAEQALADLRTQRARGGEVDPVEMTRARDAVELHGDRLRLVREAATAAERAEAERAAAEAARARLATVEDMLATTEARVRAVHDAAERLGAVMAALHEHARDVHVTEPALGAKWINGVMARAALAVTGCWPARLPLPEVRPLPYRDAATRAAWPQEERETLRLLLGPLPADPDAAPAPDAAA